MPTVRVVVAEARMIEARRTITLVASVEPVRRSRVGSEVAGLIAEVPVRQGDFVRRGGVLCRLDTTTALLLGAADVAKLAALQETHKELQAGSRKEEIRRLKALFDEAAATYERWRFEMERVQRLYDGQDSNEKEFSDTRTSYQAATRRKIAAEAAYNLGVEGPRAETIAAAGYAVAEQQAVVDRRNAELEKMVIRAPFDAYIVERLVEVGEWIPEGGAVADVVDLSAVLVRVDVPESSLPFLVVGDPVRVKVDALKRTLDGRIRHIMRQADANAHTFPVEIEVNNTAGHLAGGMFARATIPAGPPEEVIAVPTDALIERDGVTYVGIVMPGRGGGHSGMLMPVTVGTEVDGLISITAGHVRPGTQVITRGTEFILPFPNPVQIVDEKGTPVAMPAKPAKPHRAEGT